MVPGVQEDKQTTSVSTALCKERKENGLHQEGWASQAEVCERDKGI